MESNILKIEIANVHEILLRKRLFIAVLVLLTLGFALSLAGCIEQKESPQTTIPDIIIGVDSYNPPAYRGNSTLVTLVISGINVAKDEEVSLDYKTVVLRTDSSEEPDPEGIKLLPEIMKVNPVIDSNPLKGFYGKSEGIFTVIKGSIPEVKESLKEIVIEKAPQQSTFSIDDELNFVVFRGVFSSGGYWIDIDRVERQGSAFTVYATYIDPGEGILVTGAVTQPVAIIPIGRLAEGDYEVRLRVKKVKADADGTKIVRKVVEPEKELSAFNFKVKKPEGGDSSEISSIKLLPEKKPLIFQRTIKAGEPPEKLYYNLTVSIDKRAAEGDYYITISSKSSKDKGRDSAFGSAVLSFKIGKGGKLPLPEKNVWNIGYTIPSTLSEKERAIGSSSLIVGVTDTPPLSEEEKLVAIAIASNDTSLKGKSYEITGVSSGFYDSQNYSGFFPVVTIDIGEPDEPGAIVSYIIDLEEKKSIWKYGNSPKACSTAYDKRTSSHHVNST